MLRKSPQNVIFLDGGRVPPWRRVILRGSDPTGRTLRNFMIRRRFRVVHDLSILPPDWYGIMAAPPQATFPNAAVVVVMPAMIGEPPPNLVFTETTAKSKCPRVPKTEDCVGSIQSFATCLGRTRAYPCFSDEGSSCCRICTNVGFFSYDS